MEYVPFVPPQRQRNAPGPGGLLGSSASSALGTVHLFYTFGCGTYLSQTYVEISPVVIQKKIDDIFVLHSSDLCDARLDGFRRVPSKPTIMIHVDSISYKIKLVPHLRSIYQTSTATALTSIADDDDDADGSGNGDIDQDDEFKENGTGVDGIGEADNDGLMCGLRMWAAR